MNTISGLDGQSRPRPPRIFASLLLLIGLVLAAGGIQLASLGGSLYYVIAGVALIAIGSAALARPALGRIPLWAADSRHDRLGAAESGFDAWALAPRVLPFLVLGLLLLRPKARRSLGFPTERPLIASPLSWVAIAALRGNRHWGIDAPAVSDAAFCSDLRQRGDRRARLATLGRQRRRYALCAVRSDQCVERRQAGNRVDLFAPASAARSKRRRCRSATRCMSASRATSSPRSTPTPAPSAGASIRS